MPPVNKFRTYGRSSKGIVNNSVDALNLLFSKNKAKTRQNRKKKLLIKPLLARAIGETLLTSDSLHVSTEDTFDKLAKGNLYNKVNIKPQKNVKDDSNVSKSFKQVNSFYSPIMTRRRKKTASIIEISNNSVRNTSQTEEMQTCNKSNSIIPRLMEPTVDKIDFSLEVERVQKVVPTSLSYIKLPDVKEGEVSDNVVRDDISSSKRDKSFDPIFTNTFRERHAIHSSTPLIPTKIKKTIVNHTISPIGNITLPEGSFNSVKDKFIDTDISVPRNLSAPLKSVSKNVENSSTKNNSLGSDWKLNVMPKVVLTEHTWDISSCQGFEIREEIESRVALDQFSKAIDGIQNATSFEIVSNKDSRRSFITLRKRKILKSTYSEVTKKSKRNKKVESSDSTVNKIGGQSKNLTMSLDAFNAFVEKMDSKVNLRSKSTHSLDEFESFVAQNKDIINASEYVDTGQKKKTDGETPINFVAKRRRRLTDSYLISVKKPKFRKSIITTDISKRRYSFLESNCSDCPGISLKDLVVVIPKYDICSEPNNINANVGSTEYVSCSIPTEQSSSRSSSNVVEQLEHSSKKRFSSSVRNDNAVVTRFQLKNLVVNLTRTHFNTNAEKTNNSENENSTLGESGSLFGESNGYPSKSVNNSVRISAHHVTAEDLVEDGAEESYNSKKHKKPLNPKKLSKGRMKSVTKKKRSLQTDMVCECRSENSKEIGDSVAETNLTKSPVKSTFAQQTSDKSNSSVHGCSCNYSGSNVSDEIGASCASNENVSSARRTCISDVIVTENGEFSADGFENFYANVAKRSRSKHPANMKLLSRPSKTNKQISDTENHQKSDINRNTLTTSSATEFENFFIRTIEQSDCQCEPCNPTVDEEPEEKFEHTDVNLNKQEFKDLIVNITRCSWESQLPLSNAIANEEEESQRFEHDTKEHLDQRTLIVVKSPSQAMDDGNNSRISAALQGTLIDLTSPVKEDYPRKFDAEEPEEVHGETPILINGSSSLEISDIIENSQLESNDVDGDGFRIPSASSLWRRHSKTLVLKSGKLWRRSLSMYRRSSVLLNLMNKETCILKDGSYCRCPRCRVARESRCLSNRRFSVKIVPTSPAYDPQREVSVLENYAHNTSYVSDQILEDNLENNLRSLSIRQRNSSIIQNSSPVTARELVLRRCGQTEAIPFEECYPKSVLEHCQKIGEGVYGEVFLFRNPNGGTSVMKVIPIEGDLIVNGERQKKFEEIFSEIIIAQELSNLRNNKQSTTSGFSEVQKIQCIQGRYPAKLLDLWDLFDETRGSENDSPEIFGDEQLYVVLQLANGGQDMEAFIFNNAVQAYTMFQQVACTLAIAEEELRFEHRDLHWGNVLLSTVDKNKKVNFRLDGKTYEIMTKGVEVAIIDFTLSRIEYDGVVIFNDLSLDPDLFTAEGDYQFEIYKLMQKKNGDNWQRFEPYTNILWLNYTLDKAITALRYKHVQTKIHKQYISKLKQLKGAILNYSSVKEFVSSNF